MARFRRAYPKVYWVFGKFEVDGPRAVKFAFDRYWTDRAAGAVMKSSAEEVVQFDEQDLITAITYTQTPSEPVKAYYPAGSSPLPFEG